MKNGLYLYFQRRLLRSVVSWGWQCCSLSCWDVQTWRPTLCSRSSSVWATYWRHQVECSLYTSLSGTTYTKSPIWNILSQARLKKMSVSSPAVGRNCGQSGGCNFLLFFYSFGGFGRKSLSFFFFFFFFLAKMKKISCKSPLFNSPGRWTGNWIFF